MANEADIGAIITYLIAAYPQFTARLGTLDLQNRITVYLDILGDLPADLLWSATKQVISKGTFFPSAGELRTAALEIRSQTENLPLAQDAWAEVTERMRRGGFLERNPGGWYEYRAPRPDDWSHPLVQRALDAIGGWQQLRQTDNITADRARFMQAFDAYVGQYRENRDMLPVVRETIDAIRRVGGGRPLSLAEIGKALQAAAPTSQTPLLVFAGAEHQTIE